MPFALITTVPCEGEVVPWLKVNGLPLGSLSFVASVPLVVVLTVVPVASSFATGESLAEPLRSACTVIEWYIKGCYTKRKRSRRNSS